MKYRLGQFYIDKGKRTDKTDQFLRWINIDGSGMLNAPGIRPLNFASELSQSGLPAYVILVTDEKGTTHANPWDDNIDLSNSQILYWGDAKAHESKRLDDFRGNSALRKIYDYICTGERELIPPILHFSKPQKGVVKFTGLCTLDNLEISWFDDHGKPIQNYKVHLTVLDCDEVSTKWLHHRSKCEKITELNKHPDCPKVWTDYLRGRKRPIDIWFHKIISEADQLPEPGSSDDQLLKELLNLDPNDFEKVIVALFQQMTSITHHITGTRATADGGFDFFGTFKLPNPINYEIPFRGEVKRYSKSTKVDPKSLSRLVARLRRQEYEIFVTTSSFTKQAQREVYADEYPIHLISGKDLIYLIKNLGIVSSGRIKSDWLEAVLN
mgnify:CR=1 FL=1